MDEQLKSLSEKIKTLKDKVKSEEATKQSMVLPLLVILGYDIFNPEEVIPEVPCDIANKGDKVDYVLSFNGKHEILIECKECHQNLQNHISQLRKYFVASDARFAILTNGVQYLFFSDHDKSNIMDEEPFYSLDMLNLSSEDCSFMSGIRKDGFNSMQLLYNSQDIRYRDLILKNIKREFSNPSKALVSVLTSNFYKGKLNESAYSKFSALVKVCIKSLVTEDFYMDVVENKEESEEAENSLDYSKEEQEIIDIVRNWLTKYEADNHRIFIRRLSDGYIRFSYHNRWWPICSIKHRPSWDYKYSVKICINAQAANGINREVKTLDDFLKLQSEIEAQCEDSKSRMFKYRSEHNI